VADTIKRKGVLEFLTKGTDAAKDDIGGIEEALGAMKGAVLGAVSAYGALQIAQRTIEWSREAAVVQDVAGAFENMTETAGIDGVALLEKMRTATNRTVSELKLMQNANTALMLGLPIDRFDEILAIARGAAISTGQDMEFMLQSITTGLGRQSKMILDNLGILLDVEAANEAYAASIGKSAAALTETERKQAFVNAALDAGSANLEKMGGLVTSNVDGYVQFEVALDELKVTAGELAPQLDVLGGELMDMNDSLKEMGPRFRELQRQWTIFKLLSSGPVGWTILGRGLAKQLYGEAEQAAEGMAVFEEAITEYQEKYADRAAEAAKRAAIEIQSLRDLIYNVFQDIAFDDLQAALAVPTPEEALGGLTYAGAVGNEVEAIQELFEVSTYAYPAMAESVTWFADASEAALDRVIFKNAALVASLKNLIVAQNISTKSVGLAVQEAVRAELAGISARAAVDAAYYTYKGLAATASMLGGNPLGAGVAQAYFTAAAKAGAVAGMAGIGAAIGPSMGAPSYSPVSGEYGDLDSMGGATGGGERSIHVTRTAPTHINVNHFYHGDVYFGSQAESDAGSVQEQIDAGALFLPEEVA